MYLLNCLSFLMFWIISSMDLVFKIDFVFQTNWKLNNDFILNPCPESIIRFLILKQNEFENLSLFLFPFHNQNLKMKELFEIHFLIQLNRQWHNSVLGYLPLTLDAAKNSLNVLIWLYICNLLLGEIFLTALSKRKKFISKDQ